MIAECRRCGRERRIYAKGYCMYCYTASKKGAKLRKFKEAKK